MIVCQDSELLDNIIYPAGKFEISFGNATNFMRGEEDLNSIVDIRPIRVMIHGLSQQCHSTHKSEGINEILKDKLPIKLTIFETPVSKINQFFVYISLAQPFYLHYPHPRCTM